MASTSDLRRLVCVLGVVAALGHAMPAGAAPVAGTSVAVPVAGVTDWSALRARAARVPRSAGPPVGRSILHPPLPGRRALGSDLAAPPGAGPGRAPQERDSSAAALAPTAPAALSPTLGFEALPDDNSRVPDRKSVV